MAVKGLMILAWRNDVGAYVLESYPESIEADGQDIMQVYNLHRFRTTDPNFQFIKIGDVNFSSYYSGGYKSNYIGKPNYCVTLLLEATDNPSKYERVLLKATNNLLLHMNDDDFDLMLQKYYKTIADGDFESIKIERQEGVPAPKEEGTGGSEEVSDERKILENLIASTDTEEAKAEDTAPVAGGISKDPFSGGATAPAGVDPFAANPFAASETKGATATDPFATNPFQQAESVAQVVVPVVDRSPKSGKLLMDLKTEELKRPKPPANMTTEQKVSYLEELVDHFEKKLGILSKIANALQEKEKLMEEKDKLIGKLLLLLK